MMIKLTTVYLLLYLLWMTVVDCRELCKENLDCNLHGTCTDKGECDCDDGYAGELCERLETPCDSNKCLNNGVCNIYNVSQMRCDCDKRFKGVYCELDVDECQNSDICLPFETCKNHMANASLSINEDPGYMCTCAPDSSGLCPGQPADDCPRKRCIEGEWKNCSCVCKDGYGGETCDLVMPTRKEFQDNQCQNEQCYLRFNDGICDNECNNSECMYDGMDCAGSDDMFCDAALNCTEKFDNDICNEECATEQCGFDGGDCDGEDRFDPVPAGTLTLRVDFNAKPQEALTLVHDLEDELSRLFFTLVKATRDDNGLVLHAFIDGFGAVRLFETDFDNPSLVNSMGDSSFAFFEIDVHRCIRERARNRSTHCFDSARSAAAYLSVHIARKSQIFSRTTRKITSVALHTKGPSSNSLRDALIIACVTLVIAIALCCVLVIGSILRSRTGKGKFVHAEIWNIPEDLESNELYKKRMRSDSLDGSISSLCPPPSKKVAYEIDLDGYILGEPNANTVERVFLKAVRNRNYDVVRAMLQDEKKLLISKYHDDQGLGPIHHAIANGDTRMLELLVESDLFDIFERNEQRQSAIVYASRVGIANLEIYKIITDEIDAQRKIDAFEESTLLHTDDHAVTRYEARQAAKKHKMRPLSCEIDPKVALTDEKERTALHYAALNNRSDVIRFLLEKGADVDYQDCNGDSPLHLAAANGCLQACAALIAAGCSKAVLNNFEENARTLADLRGYTDVAQMIGGFSPSSPLGKGHKSYNEKHPRALKRGKVDSTLPRARPYRLHQSELSLDRKASFSPLYTPITTATPPSLGDANRFSLIESANDAENGFCSQYSLQNPSSLKQPMIRILTPREELVYEENSFINFRQEPGRSSPSTNLHTSRSVTPPGPVALVSSSFSASGHDDSTISSIGESVGFT